jgi:hypothetical protein
MDEARRVMARVEFVALLVVLSAGAAAQNGRVVRGTVSDGSAQPVGGVAIIAGTRSVTSDDSGRFRVDAPHRDKLVLDFKRVGFLPTRFTLEAGGDTTLDVLLLPTINQIPGVEVTASRDPAMTLRGFEERMRERRRGAGAGHFITAREIESNLATRTTQIVSNIPSIVVRRLADDHFGIFGKTGGAAECPAIVYLDGIRLGALTETRTDRRGRVIVQRDAAVPIDQYVTPGEIAGVEVYARGMFAPPQFQPPGDPTASKCAIVVFWTKHGGSSRR